MGNYKISIDPNMVLTLTSWVTVNNCIVCVMSEQRSANSIKDMLFTVEIQVGEVKNIH